LDDIPGIFETPSTEDVSIELEGTELKADQYRIDVVSGVQIEEKHLSPDGGEWAKNYCRYLSSPRSKSWEDSTNQISTICARSIANE